MCIYIFGSLLTPSVTLKSDVGMWVLDATSCLKLLNLILKFFKEFRHKYEHLYLKTPSVILKFYEGSWVLS